MSAHEYQERRQYLSFTLAGGDHGVALLQVKEILRYEAVTRIPSVPPAIRGVLNLRGAVIPVLDLAVKFGLPPTPVTSRTCVLIVEVSLEGEPAVMGILADRVREVLELGASDVLPPPTFGTGVTVEHITGMARVDGGFVLLLDLDGVVSAAGREVAARAASATSLPESLG